jgi:aminoglycoside phosphotransferase family enzyme/predicted kinase
MTAADDVHAWLAAQSERFIETSCARVYLFENHTLKVKTPVDMGFLDFTTAEKRRWALERELSFNQAYAPDIYREIRRVTRREGGFALDGAGETVEWALEMRRFPDDAVLSGHPDKVDGALGEALGRMIARSHISAPVKRDGGGRRAMAYTLRTNADQLNALAPRLGADVVRRLIAGSDAALEAAAPLLDARAAEGLARRCHGDLHLGNILIENGAPKLFDCIEFNDMLSDIDTLYDLAFLIMDLDVRGRDEAANRALNGYLDEAARGLPATLWGGLAALPLMLSARAAVRAHVSAHGGDDGLGQKYARAALGYLKTPAPRVYAIGGLSGSGKTTLARAVAPRVGGAPGALVLRSDEIRKRLWAAAPLERLPPDAYSARASERVHAEMFRLADVFLAAGRSVVLDATFIEEARRGEAEAVADKAGAPFQGVWLATDEARLRERLASRRGDASDANEAVSRAQRGLDPGAIDWARLDAGAGIDALLSNIGVGSIEGGEPCTG